MSDKVVGYVLLAVGVFVILFALVNVWMVFNKSAKPIQLFNFDSISVDLGGALIGSLPEEQQAYLKGNNSKQMKTELLPANVLNDTSNIFAHLLFMGFVASMGYKLASLGVNLLRPIVVKSKT